MKLKRVNSKILMIITCVVLIFIATILLVYFNLIKPKKQTVASVGEPEENILLEEPIEEYIDINELEGNIIQVEITEENETNSNVNQNKKPTVASGSTPYYIKVNYGAQVVTIYGKDSQGKYTVPVKAMVCSTGAATPKSGVYTIPARWEWLRLEGYVYGHYSTQITGNILFHSVPYLRKNDPASLEYWEYDKLGSYASAGCIRLTVRDAKWIFNNCARGTKVEFYSSSNPGPLGKPSAKKISSYPDYLRNWDPTDSNSSNPWHTYQEPPKQEEKPKEENPPKQEEKPSKPTKNEIENEITNETVNEQQNQIVNEIVNEIEDKKEVEKNQEKTNVTTL